MHDLKGNLNEISSEIQCKVGNARFSTIKPISDL